jgi:hypothetical protein
MSILLAQQDSLARKIVLLLSRYNELLLSLRSKVLADLQQLFQVFYLHIIDEVGHEIEAIPFSDDALTSGSETLQPILKNLLVAKLKLERDPNQLHAWMVDLLWLSESMPRQVNGIQSSVASAEDFILAVTISFPEIRPHFRNRLTKQKVFIIFFTIAVLVFVTIVLAILPSITRTLR